MDPSHVPKFHYCSTCRYLAMGCGLARNKVQTIEVSQRLSLSPDAKANSFVAKCNLHSVTAEELRLISKLYRNLSERSNGENIDKTTFLLFFPLPVDSYSGSVGRTTLRQICNEENRENRLRRIRHRPRRLHEIHLRGKTPLFIFSVRPERGRVHRSVGVSVHGMS